MKVGFIGIGDQGGPMARHILDAGFDLVVFARRRVQAQPLLDAGAHWADNLEQLGSECEVVGVCVGSDDDLEEIYRPLIANMRPSSVFIVHSTVHPDLVLRISAEARPSGVDVLDAPVSGGHQGAVDATLAILVGGDADVLDRARPVLEACGRPVLAGPLGSGELIKLVNNYLLAIQVEVAHEAVEMIGRLDIALPVALEALASSTGSTYVLRWMVEHAAVEGEPGINVFPGVLHESGRMRAAEILQKDIDHVHAVLARVGGRKLRLEDSLASAMRVCFAGGQHRG